MPLAPAMNAVIEQHARHDDGQVRAEIASPLELAHDAVIVLAELQLHDRAELFGLRLIEPLPVRDEADHAIDEGEVLLQESAGIQWAIHPLFKSILEEES